MEKRNDLQDITKKYFDQEAETYDTSHDGRFVKCMYNEIAARGCKLSYQRAGIEDLDVLVKTRSQVLIAANKLKDNVDMSEVEMASRQYYQEALEDGSHIAYLVFDGDIFAGAGGVSFYRVMPTFHNPSGKKAYLMNLYTHPKYRRRGIAYRTLDILVNAAKKAGVFHITLEATEMGRMLYEKYGFISMKDEMELPVGNLL